MQLITIPLHILVVSLQIILVGFRILSSVVDMLAIGAGYAVLYSDERAMRSPVRMRVSYPRYRKFNRKRGW